MKFRWLITTTKQSLSCATEPRTWGTNRIDVATKALNAGEEVIDCADGTILQKENGPSIEIQEEKTYISDVVQS